MILPVLRRDSVRTSSKEGVIVVFTILNILQRKSNYRRPAGNLSCVHHISCCDYPPHRQRLNLEF